MFWRCGNAIGIICGAGSLLLMEASFIPAPWDFRGESESDLAKATLELGYEWLPHCTNASDLASSGYFLRTNKENGSEENYLGSTMRFLLK